MEQVYLILLMSQLVALVYFKKTNNLKILMPYLYLTLILVQQNRLRFKWMNYASNNTTQMYQSIGVINDEKAGGLKSLLNYMNENLFSKDDHT